MLNPCKNILTILFLFYICTAFRYENIKKSPHCYIALSAIAEPERLCNDRGVFFIMTSKICSKRLKNPKHHFEILPGEEWKPIQNYESYYLASTFGRIRSNYNRVILMTFKADKDGYLLIGLTKNRKQSTFRVHRLIADTFIPNLDNLPEINHKDLNKQNNRVDNLEWVTGRENKKHFHKDKNSNTGILLYGKKYRVFFTAKRKQYYVGTFNTYEEAEIKYNEALNYKDNPMLLMKIINKNRTKLRKNV